MQESLDENAVSVMKKRLRFQSWHRGCKETDLILGHFCDQYLEHMTTEELYFFEMVLDEDDADLFQWLTGERDVPDRLLVNPIMTRLLHFDVQTHLPQMKRGE